MLPIASPLIINLSQIKSSVLRIRPTSCISGSRLCLTLCHYPYTGHTHRPGTQRQGACSLETLPCQLLPLPVGNVVPPEPKGTYIRRDKPTQSCPCSRLRSGRSP